MKNKSTMTIKELNIENTMIELIRSAEAIEFETNPKELIKSDIAKALNVNKNIYLSQVIEHSFESDRIDLYVDSDSSVVAWSIPYTEEDFKYWFFADEVEKYKLWPGDVRELDVPNMRVNLLTFFLEKFNEATLTVE